MKKVDITEKLSFDENPRIVISGKEYEVNSDAKTVLEIMGAFRDKSDVEAALKAYELLFSKKDRESIENLKLPWKDLEIIIDAAISLVTGSDENVGE